MKYYFAQNLHIYFHIKPITYKYIQQLKFVIMFNKFKTICNNKTVPKYFYTIINIDQDTV